MKIMRNVISGQAGNCYIRIQIRFTAIYIGKRPRKWKQIYVGIFAPTHGHKTKSGYKLNDWYFYVSRN